MDVNLNVPAIEKLVDYAASGIGSVAGTMLAPWRARREARAKQLAAEGAAGSLLIQARAQAEARAILVSHDSVVSGALDIADRVNQRIQFQEQKRQSNIESVVTNAAKQLDDRTVAREEPDHDWMARFFNSVQDVSSDDMQTLWARVLSGEVERKGSTSVRTLGILRDLDRTTAGLFRKFCSSAVFLGPERGAVVDARVPSLGGNASANSLQSYGLSFDALNRLNEHGLIIADYNSWFDYQVTIGLPIGDPSSIVRMPFAFQGKNWVLVPREQRKPTTQYKLSGVALTMSGRELAAVIDLQGMEGFAQDLISYFKREQLRMIEVAVPRQAAPLP